MINRINTSSVVFTIVMMKLLFLCSVVFVVVSAHKCKPKYHFWRPYNGTVPRDAFVASVDEDGTKSYVAKIIPMDQYSWTVPTQFREGECDHLDFSWCCKANSLMRVDEFIEILCTEEPANLGWRKVDAFASEISDQCCMVQGGIGWFDNHVYRAFIGRGKKDEQFFIGRIYLEHQWEGIHIMDGSASTKIYKDFEVLTYDCKEKSFKTIPVQFEEGWDHVDFSWCCKKNNTMRVDEFIEIMCTDESEQLHWRSVHQNVEEIRSHCCPVEGGIGYRNGRKMKAYIGRALRNGVGHIGRVYLKKITQGLHIMTGTNATKIMEDFDILSYDCKEDEVPLPKPE